jgi:hypothetical protein
MTTTNINIQHQHSIITTNIMLRAVKQLCLLLGILLMALPCLSLKASLNIQGRVYPVHVQNDQDKNELSSMNRRKRKMTDVTVPSPTSKALCFRGGSLTVEEETDTKSILTKVRNVIRSLLHMGGKKSPLVTQLFKSVIGWVEYLIGTPLLPLPKSSSKQKISKRGRHEKKQKTKSQSHSTVQEDTIKSSKPRKGSLDSLNKNRVHVPKKGQEKVQTGEKRTRLDPINKGNSNNKRSNTGHSHLNTNIKSTNSNYRIQRELKEFLSSPPPNLAVKVGKNIRLWIITMTGAKNSIYEGETYRLRVQFPPEYPTVPPSVYFLQPTPRHEHVCKLICSLLILDSFYINTKKWLTFFIHVYSFHL